MLGDIRLPPPPKKKRKKKKETNKQTNIANRFRHFVKTIHWFWRIGIHHLTHVIGLIFNHYQPFSKPCINHDRKSYPALEFFSKLIQKKNKNENIEKVRHLGNLLRKKGSWEGTMEMNCCWWLWPQQQQNLIEMKWKFLWWTLFVPSQDSDSCWRQRYKIKNCTIQMRQVKQCWQ